MIENSPPTTLHPLRAVPRSQPPELNDDIVISRGYRPGILGRCLVMHMEYYSGTVNFGSSFETQLATGIGDLLSRIEQVENEVWAAVCGDQIVGTIWMDGQNTNSDLRKVYLRAFIVDENVKGNGVGRRLLKHAIEWADESGFEEVELWTFRGLDAASKLYIEFGFVVREEGISKKFSQELMVQHLVRRRETEADTGA